MHADAIVVLGCRIGPGGRPTGASERRTLRAARAFEEGVARLVVATGGKRWSGVAEATAMAALLAERGVPRGSIVTECRSLSTRENALFTAALLARQGAATVAVVTCDWHTPRALACFRATGIEAFGLPAKSPPAPWGRGFVRGLRERARVFLDATAVRAERRRSA